MTYNDALDYITRLSSFGMMLGLTRIEKLLEALGNPEDQLKIIHIAGTNGKGSVGAFLSEILGAAGYKMGRFVSPTLFDYRERIQVDGEYITEDGFTQCAAMIQDACAVLEQQGIEQPTQFEVDTAMAFLYFTQMHCDYVILEVGLGGRQDATNAIKNSMMSVITSVSFDHTKILGDTLTRIAEEKAGIIKANQYVVTCPQKDEVMQVLAAECEKQNAHLITSGFAVDENKFDHLETQSFDYKDLCDLKISLLGTYQKNNAALAVEAALTLINHYGLHITEEQIRSGLLKTRWAGRFEIVSKEPLVVVDGAHNPDGAEVLAESVARYFGKRHIILIMGIFADKEYTKILEIMSPYAYILIAHKPEGTRGLASDVLAKEARQYFSMVYDGQTICQAYDMARQMANPEDVILSFGSLSTIGELTTHIRET